MTGRDDDRGLERNLVEDQHRGSLVRRDVLFVFWPVVDVRPQGCDSVDIGGFAPTVLDPRSIKPASEVHVQPTGRFELLDTGSCLLNRIEVGGTAIGKRPDADLRIPVNMIAEDVGEEIRQVH